MLIDLLVHGPASRADLARRAGLSPASLTRITRSLVDVDPVTESDAAFPQRTGRPSQPMDVNVDLAHLVGIKLSATQLNLVTTGLRARWFGAAAGCRDFVLVTIGVGVGCGIVIDDRLVDGASDGCGQIGHLPVSEWGLLCERGHRGCNALIPVVDLDRRAGCPPRSAGRCTTRRCWR